MSKRYILGDTEFVNVHKKKDCGGKFCVFHNPKHTFMDEWPLIWRDDRGIFERICSHGTGHPDPSQQDYWRKTGQEWQMVHGCDRCCAGAYDKEAESRDR